MDAQTIGVAGLGMLGRGIATCFLGHGFRVVGYTRRASTHDAARQYIAEGIRDLIERAGFDASLADHWPDRYTAVESCDWFGDCDFVVESVAEDVEVKQQVFDQIEAVVRSDVPIASNTSALPISRLQAGRKHAERFLGMHWCEPAHVTRFLELVRGEQTSDAAFEAAEALGIAVGKEPSLVQKDVPAFVANRIGYAMYREALNILERGIADVETIDRSFRNAVGLWSTLGGPFWWMDISGGPALYAHAMEHVLPDLNNSPELPEILKRFRDEDAGGITNDRGFYAYTDEEARRWKELLREHAWIVRELMNKYYPPYKPRSDQSHGK